MQSIVTILDAPASPALLDLDEVKAELGISGTGSDQQLGRIILRAGAAVQGYLGRTLGASQVSEEFRADIGVFQPRPAPPPALDLSFWPGCSIISVTIDDDAALAATLYQVDAEKGLLYRLDDNGARCRWWACSKTVVLYTGGYALPLDPEAGPEAAAVQAATMQMVTGLWSTMGRDPALKAEDIPGIARNEYWVESAGGTGQLPGSIAVLLDPYRTLAV